jgi:tartrate-resistant acid phosphatase type 5
MRTAWVCGLTTFVIATGLRKLKRPNRDSIGDIEDAGGLAEEEEWEEEEVEAGVEGPALPSPPSPLATCTNLLIIGDFGKSGSIQRQVRDSMASVAQSMQADAILALGDNVYESGANSESVMTKEWRDVYLTRSALNRKWYAIKGNHDWYTTSRAMERFTNSSKNSGKSWRMDHFWHRHTIRNVEMFFIDTEIIRGTVRTGDRSTQNNWFESRLKSSRAAWKIVSGHHPIYSGGSHGGSGTVKNLVDPLMRKNGATIYFSGHDHSQQHMHHNGVDYVLSGAGSKEDRSSRRGNYPSGAMKKYVAEPGFASLSICNDREATLKFYKKTGSVAYTRTLRNVAYTQTQDAEEPETGEIAEASGVEEHDGSEARCGDVEMQKVNFRCSEQYEDGCTVQPDVDPTSVSCMSYCSWHGLSCTGAWQNKRGACGRDVEWSCDKTGDGSLSFLCRCGKEA